MDFTNHWHVYGSDLPQVRALFQENPSWEERLHPDLPYTQAEVIWAARNEMAQTIEDVLARRTRALFLDARVSVEMSKLVADLLSVELGKDSIWVKSQIDVYTELAKNYILD